VARGRRLCAVGEGYYPPVYMCRKRCTIIGADNSERVYERQRGEGAQALRCRGRILSAHVMCCKRCTIIGVDNSERVYERQRGKGAQALRCRGRILSAHVMCCKRCTIIGVDNSERVYERQRGEGAQALRPCMTNHVYFGRTLFAPTNGILSETGITGDGTSPLHKLITNHYQLITY